MNSNHLPPRHHTSVTSTHAHHKGQLLLFLTIFVLVSTLAALDLISDLGKGASTFHLTLEGLLVLSGLIGIFVMARSLFQLSSRASKLQHKTLTLHQQLKAKTEETRALNVQLSRTEAEALQWQKEARDLLKGLSLAIDQQFDRWELTAAEKEVALLLLKGLSTKEIAAIRDTADSTTRQQARTIYKKGNLSGRNQLSAFFLEDLLLPQPTPSPSHTS